MKISQLLSEKSQKQVDEIMQIFKEEEEQIREKQRHAHLEFLKKYGFKSAKEVFDYIYSGHEMYDGYDDKIKLMNNGSIGHWALWLSDDDCAVLGYFWRTQTKDSFEEWINSLFSNEGFLDNGYLNYWFKSKE